MDPRRSWPHGALAGVLIALSAFAHAESRLVLESTRVLATPDFVQPIAIAAAPFGRLYVADVGRGGVLRLGAQARPLFVFESPAYTAGMQPIDLAVTGFQVYVLDAQSNALLRFTDRGAFLDVLRRFEEDRSETPRGVAVDALGRVLLAQPDRHQVRILDQTQRAETVVGGFGDRPGEMLRPESVAFGPDGSFYVSDVGQARVQRFTAVGNFDATLSDSLVEPRGLATSRTGELFVADSGRRSVHFFSARNTHLAEIGLNAFTPADVAVVGDTVWVLSVDPAALLRVQVRRGG